MTRNKKTHRVNSMVLDAVAAMKGTQPEPEWGCKLIRTKEGTIKALLANAITALRLAPEWAGVPSFNEFAWRVIQNRPAPWIGATTGQWTDNEDRLTADWLQHHGVHVGVEVAGQAVQTVARDRQFHPVRTYLDSLHWDGQARLARWLATWLGSRGHGVLGGGSGLRWTRSAVARIYRPGSQGGLLPDSGRLRKAERRARH